MIINHHPLSEVLLCHRNDIFVAPTAVWNADQPLWAATSAVRLPQLLSAPPVSVALADRWPLLSLTLLISSPASSHSQAAAAAAAEFSCNSKYAAIQTRDTHSFEL